MFTNVSFQVVRGNFVKQHNRWEKVCVFPEDFGHKNLPPAKTENEREITEHSEVAGVTLQYCRPEDVFFFIW